MTMTTQRLHDLFDENPAQDSLAWKGHCHTCGTAVLVAATLCAEGIQVEGGSVYEPNRNEFHLKCPECYAKDATLRNYQACEVYSRVVGYLRPVSQWNGAKVNEFADRSLFDESAGLSAGGTK